VVYFARLEQLLELLRHVRRPEGDVQVPDAQHEDHGGRLPSLLRCFNASKESSVLFLPKHSINRKRGQNISTQKRASYLVKGGI